MDPFTIAAVAAGLYVATRGKKSAAGGAAAGGSPAPGAGSSTDKLAAEADKNFAGAMVAAHGLLTSAAAVGATPILAGTLGQVVIASAETDTAIAWGVLPKSVKARIFAGGAAKAAGSAGAASRGLTGLGDATLPGCANPAPGFFSLVCYLAQQISNRVHALGVKLCASADTAVAALRARGIKTPAGWSGLSCDQKVGFLAALGPLLGLALPALLVAGAVASVIQSRQAAQLATAVSAAAQRVGGQVAADFQAAANAVVNVGQGIVQGASNVVQSANPFNGLGII